eukprot:TRINITY_DN1537_c0_g1_i2.p1 TRINITY_DN1537_c0_g1~~TRINITY_DN1537_c0_g1_i2.p1  ORF type:complete len:357 (-),score=40.98 TRINITY_DN1537_c0_g1_i2:47-1117(-)
MMQNFHVSNRVDPRTQSNRELEAPAGAMVPTRGHSAMAMFSSMDTDGNGELDMNELRQGLSDLGFEDAAIDSSMMAMDTNCDGVVSKQEFNKYYPILQNRITKSAVSPRMLSLGDGSTAVQQRESPETTPVAIYGRSVLEGSGRIAPSDSSLDGARQEEMLILAASCGDLVMMQRVFALGVSPDFVGEDGSTALMWASRMGQLSAVDALLHAKACVDLESSGRRALCEAVAWGQVRAIKMLVQNKADPNRRTDLGWLPLSLAADLTERRECTAKALIECKADIRLCESGRLRRWLEKVALKSTLYSPADQIPSDWKFIPPARTANVSRPFFTPPRSSPSRLEKRHMHHVKLQHLII